jgi:nicotinamide mononucleotide transporter
MSISSISLRPSVRDLLPDKNQSLMVHMAQGTLLGVVLTALSHFVGVSMGWTTGLSSLEAFCVFTSYVCTFLCVVERRINYPIGAISNAAYCLFFAQAGLVGSSIVTGYLTFSLAYGWFRWKSDTNTKPVGNVAMKYWPVYIGATAVAFLGGFWLYGVFDTPVVWTDLVVMAGSILAQFLLDNKRIETWAVWAVVNVFAIYTYINVGASLVAFQYVFFLLNAFYGWYMWQQSRKPIPTEFLLSINGDEFTRYNPHTGMRTPV